MTSTTARPVELTGRIVRAGDADYPVASAGYNLLFTHDPAVIVFAQETQDVVNALAWARQNNVVVRVRSGRHSLEGWSNVDDGIVIDVSEMKSATVDSASNTATVGAGLNQLEAVAELGKAGVAAATGTEGTVGLVGATLGGGFGLLTRGFGMASDNLLAADVVVASGSDGAKAIIVDEQNNSDLLWALRGAGNGSLRDRRPGRGYADNGLEHVIVGNCTGIVGGVDEINANTGQLAALVATLGKLA